MFSAQTSLIKFKIEALADTSIRSCFSEYCDMLSDNYDLFYVDTAYKVSDGGIGSFINHLAGYIDENIITECNTFYKISYTDVSVISCVFANDDNYMSLQDKIYKYVNDKGINATYDEALDYYIFEKLSCKSELKSYSINEYEIEYVATGSFEELLPENDIQPDETGCYDDQEYKEALADMLKDISYEVKLERLVDIIEINMRENYSEFFDFDDLLESAEIKFYMDGNGKIYEITKKYGI